MALILKMSDKSLTTLSGVECGGEDPLSRNIGTPVTNIKKNTAKPENIGHKVREE